MPDEDAVSIAYRDDGGRGPVEVRYQGESHETTDDLSRWVQAFALSHRRRKGVADDDTEARAEIIRDAYVMLGVPREFMNRIPDKYLFRLGRFGDGVTEMEGW